MYPKINLTKINVLALIAAVVFVIASCKGGNKSGDQAAASDSLNLDTLKAQVKEVVYPLPTPFEMTKMLNDIGVTYSSKNLNPANKVEKYFTEQTKALNLGVYGADLVYASTFQQQQDIQVYLKSIKTLVDQLGITIDYGKLLSDEFKEKLNNKDSLTKIVTETFYNTYNYLNQKSNPDLSVMMVTGMWVELMYIATNISEKSYNYTGLVNIISKQKDSYEKVMELLKSRDTNSAIKDLETKLEALKAPFGKVEAGLSEADYNVILQTIKAVRSSLVS